MSRDWLDITRIMEAHRKKIPVALHPLIDWPCPLVEKAREGQLFIREVSRDLGDGVFNVRVDGLLGAVPVGSDGTLWGVGITRGGTPVFVHMSGSVGDTNRCCCASPKPILLLIRTICDSCGKEIG